MESGDIFRSELRKKAEKLLETDLNSTVEFQSKDELIQELRTHQIELELQNEELCESQSKLEEAQHKYFDLFNFAPVGYFTLDKNGLILEANLAGAALLGVEKINLQKKAFINYINPEHRNLFHKHCIKVLKTGTKNTVEIKLLNPNKMSFYAHLETTYQGYENGDLKEFRIIVTNIDKLKKDEKVLKNGKNEYQNKYEVNDTRLNLLIQDLETQLKMINISYAAIFSWDYDKGILTWNHGAEQLYGYSKKEAIGSVSHDLLKTEFPIEFTDYIKKLMENKTWTGDLTHTTKDGQKIVVESRQQLILDNSGNKIVIETNQDITERNKVEFERETSIEFLRIVNESKSLDDLIHSAITFFKHQSGCEAVGIRLREGDDYPYYEAHGFPEEFLQLENHLCEYDQHGNPCRDSEDKALIECMCGNIISGRFDPKQPFFTNNGSFWTNNTTQLLENTSEEDKQSRTRNRCNGEGYESVALIPLHDNVRNLGLLQMNDRKKNVFSIELISIWERLAGYLAVALAKFRAEEEIIRHGTILNSINQVFQETLTCESEEEVIGRCLEVAGNLTESEFGFFGEINENGRLDYMAFTSQVWDACEIPNAVESIMDLEIVSYWGRVIKEEKSQIVNDPDNDPDRRGLPEGHPSITSFLGVPLIQGDKTIGIITLANKKEGYNEVDKKNVEAISGAFVEALMRKRAEIKISESKDNLELKVHERTLELEKSYESLIQKEGQYLTLFNSIDEGFCTIEVIFDDNNKPVDYRFLEVNPAFEEQTGFIDAQGKLMRDLAADHEEYWFETYGKIALTGLPMRFINEAKELNRWYDVYAFKVGEPESREVAILFNDITKFKQTENELELLNNYNRSLIEANLDPLVTIGPDGKITDLNRSTEDITGYKKEDIIGTDFSDYFTEPENARKGYKQVFEEGSVQDYPLDIKHKNGITTPVLYNASVYKDKSGEVIGVFAAARDITQMKIAENKLKEYQDTLEEKVKIRTKELAKSNADLKQFAYITSHDLREPLRMITGFLQLLEKRYKDQLDQDANDFIDFAVNGAKRLDNMTNDLLSYSKITRQKRELTEINFEEVLEEALMNLKLQIEENNAVITHDPLPIIMGDEELKVQLFQNLIGNAIKYRSQKTPKIHVSAIKERDRYLFSIKDNGIGMSPEHSQRIFTIFQRLHTHEEYEGTGIGLAIAQKIVEQQGGKIWVESELNKGSTFYFTILINNV